MSFLSKNSKRRIVDPSIAYSLKAKKTNCENILDVSFSTHVFGAWFLF